MTIKPQLIKIIDYGVSKEKKDLGKGLRIQSFNFLKSILGTRQIEDYFDPIISKCLQKLNEQTSNDLILKRIHIIRVICEKDFTLLTPHQNQFANHVGVQKGALKPFTSGNAVDDQRNEGYLKGLLGEVVKISTLNPEGLEDIKGMSNRIKTYPKLQRFMKGEQSI